jgi:aspartyl-tRNA(Asn)/glutamyl-tRNA(Gln) amidotransferase subunit C
VPIDANEALRIARLARLELEAESIPRLRQQIQSILDYVTTIEELDVTDVAPTVAPRDDGGAMRADRVEASLDRRDALRNAPDLAEGMFRVPRVLSG